ncbi:MAG: hypothetical protein ABI434_16920 [Burkholderiaceae bacterium]
MTRHCLPERTDWQIKGHQGAQQGLGQLDGMAVLRHPPVLARH